MENTSIEPIKQDKQTQVGEKDFNGIVKGLFVFFLATSAINSVSKLVTNLTWGNTSLGIIMFLCEAACCYFIYVMLQKKSWGLLALFGMLLLQIPLNLILGNPNMESVYISTFMRIGIFSLLLLIPKNKITGWSVFFGKQSQEDNSGMESKEDSAEGLANEDEQSISAEPIVPDSESCTNSIDAHVQEVPSDAETDIIPIEDKVEDSETTQVSEVKVDHINKRVVLPLWALIATIILFLVVICLFVFNLFSNPSSERKGNWPSKIERTLKTKSLDYPSVASQEMESAYSDEELANRRRNIARLYEIYIEEHYPKIADNIEDFTSMLSQRTIRKRVHAQLDIDYDMDKFEVFEKKIYPATQEHLDKEINRKWLYEKFQKAGLVVGTYNTFTTLICEDSNLDYYYREGIKLGLELGTYDEFVKAIK